jgi:O6-methylguanine-DNA--protein-cysteine methyltransferase
MDIVEDKDLEAVEATQGEVSPEELLSPDAETATQDETTEEEPKEEKAETVAYTDEEFDELHINDMDESRLTPTQKKYFLKAKDLEKGYTKKYEQLAHEKKQYETLSQRTIQTQQPQYADIYEAFDHDSKTVMQNLDKFLLKRK